LAQVGVTILLFVVGLRLDLRHVRRIGPVALATGLGQLAFTIFFGFLLTSALGKGWVEALYVAVALTFSSTIIIVKLLSDKKEIDSLHGRIAVGFLIVQDIAVVVAMMTMSAVPETGGEGAVGEVVASLAVRLAAAAAFIYLAMRFVLPRVVDLLARSQELLLVFAIAWGTALAAGGEAAGFSKEAGAFLAGFSLASTDYREIISARLTSIRDFLLLFFFVDMGAKLDFSTLGGELVPAGVLSAFVLVGNPLIVLAIMGWMGYRKRTGFLAGLTVAQISEFSIVFVAMGITLGHIGVEALGLVTLVGIVTITLSTYMILYSHALYERLAPSLGLFERRVPFREIAEEEGLLESAVPDVLVIGLGRYGGRLALQLQAAGLAVVGVDFDPEVVRMRRVQGLRSRFGDGEDLDFLDSLPIDETPWVVSTLPDVPANRTLFDMLKRRGFRGRMAVAARDEHRAAELQQLGTVHVLYPYQDAADFAARELAEHIAADRGPIDSPSAAN
jgi:Kef-type K+ transport system membrane component KefB